MLELSYTALQANVLIIARHIIINSNSCIDSLLTTF